jgi:hypothetical protein
MFGQSGAGLAADGNGDGTVNQADYDVWQSNFGDTGGSGSTSGGLLAIHGGTLKVPNITGSLINTGGTYAASAVPGLRTIGGSLAENLGVMQVLIGGINAGSNYDQIQVGGAASLGGTLLVQLANSFTPSLGQSFEFLTAAGSVSGTFSTMTLPSLGAGKAWQLLYEDSDLKLTVVAAGSAASILSSGYNTNGGGATSVAVPEPSTLASIGAAAITISLVRARRRNASTLPLS